MIQLETLIGGEPSWDECEYLTQLRDAFGFAAIDSGTPEYLAEANNLLVYEAEDYGVKGLKKTKPTMSVKYLEAILEKNAIIVNRELDERTRNI